MKDGVVIVNTARGAVIDEAALVDALDSGKVFSAGLDVFEDEPKVHPGLIRNPNVLLVPHMGTWTVEVSQSCLIYILAYLVHTQHAYSRNTTCGFDLTFFCTFHRLKLPWKNGQLKMSGLRSKRGS